MRKSRFAWTAVYLASVAAAILLAYRTGRTTSRYASDAGYSVASQLVDISTALSKPQIPRTAAGVPIASPVTSRTQQVDSVAESAAPDSITVSLACWKRLDQAELDAANSRAEYLTAKSKLDIARAEHEREMAATRLKLQLVKMDQRALLKHQHQAARSEQADAILIALRRYEQAQTRLQWSQRLADRALISQAALETDEAAAKRRGSELKVARNQMKVLEQSTFTKQTLEFERSANSLEWELARLTKRHAKEVGQLEMIMEDKRVVLEDAVAELEAARAQCSSVTMRDDVDSATVHVVLKMQHEAIDRTNDDWLRIQSDVQRQQEQNKADLAHAEMSVRAARLALIEYLEGRYPQQRHAILSEISDIYEQLGRARQRVIWSKRVIAKGYVTQSHLEADQLVVAEHEAALKKANNKLTLLDEFTHRRSQFELQSRLDQAEQELARRKRASNAQMEKLNAESAAAESQREHRLTLARRVTRESSFDLPEIESEDVPSITSIGEAVASAVGE